MEYHFDATEDFLMRQNEIHILLNTANEKIEEKDTFLKLAVVSLVTKFQVYIESVLKEFLYNITSRKIQYNKLSIYMRLNSIKIGLNDNALVKLAKHNKFNSDTSEKIKKYLDSISFIMDENLEVDDKFTMKTTYPLGRTGKDELLELFKQIEGNENIFFNQEKNEELIDLNQLDSLLLTRHLIIHQDRFNQTDNKIIEYVKYLNKIVLFCDEYLNTKLVEYGIGISTKQCTVVTTDTNPHP
jgi:predicted transcriptional regulator